MARIIQKASELAPIMVLQANTEIEPNLAERASVAFLKKLLEENGFPQVAIFARPNYPRPLLVGKALPEM